MTISSEKVFINHVGDGVTVDFIYDFRVDSELYMTVFYDGVEQSAGWSVSGIGDPAGGIVTFYVAPADTVQVTLMRNNPYTQLSEFETYGKFPATVVELTYDQIVMQIQQLAEHADRTFTAPPGSEGGDYEMPAPEADKVLVWNSTGDALINGPEIGDFQTWVDEAEAAAAAAEASEIAAAASEVLAYRWAQEAEDVPVTGVEYSAFHWAQKAASGGVYDVLSADTNMLTTALNASTHFSTITPVTNVAAGMVKITDSGYVPADLLPYTGLEMQGFFEGRDTCPKFSDNLVEDGGFDQSCGAVWTCDGGGGTVILNSLLTLFNGAGEANATQVDVDIVDSTAYEVTLDIDSTTDSTFVQLGGGTPVEFVGAGVTTHTVTSGTTDSGKVKLYNTVLVSSDVKSIIITDLCTEPDYRSPTERFGAIFNPGDYFVVTDIPTTGHINLIDPADMTIKSIEVFEGDGIVYLAADTIGIGSPAGWLQIPGLSSGSVVLASDVTFDDTGTTIKGVNVQVWNQAADAEIANKVDKTGGIMTGSLVHLDDTIYFNDISVKGLKVGNTTAIDLLYVGADDHIYVGGCDTDHTGNLYIRSQGANRIGITTDEVLFYNSDLRLDNDSYLMFRNAADDDNVLIASVDAVDDIFFGGLSGHPVTANVKMLQGHTVAIDIAEEDIFFKDRSLYLDNSKALFGANAADTLNFPLVMVSATDDIYLGGFAYQPVSSSVSMWQGASPTLVFNEHDAVFSRTPMFIKVSDTVTGTHEVDFQTSPKHDLTLSGNTTLTFKTTTTTSYSANYTLEVDTAGNTLTLPTGIYWPDGVVPTIESGVWIISLYWNSTVWYATAAKFSV